MTCTSIDSLNHATMNSAVSHYATKDELYIPERAALECIADEMRGKRILDLGVGGGRTVKALRALSDNYVGVDYVPAMVDRCRRQFPGVKFECADARSMPEFATHSFDLVVFSCNGISMVDHAGRLDILNEVYRILAPNGIFMFSTYNRNSAEHDSLFRFPIYEKTKNPVKIVVRSTRFFAQSCFRLVNRARYARHETMSNEYSIINDQCHHYQTLLYYLTMESQHIQLSNAGFKPCAIVYDSAGKVVDGDTREDSMMFVARR